MKVLITGEHSYIGNSVAAWLKAHSSITVIKQSLRNKVLAQLIWKEIDCVFHVAGLAHLSKKKSMIAEYIKVNRDLAIDVAKKAKESGVKHFIFTSTMAIYGKDIPIGRIQPIEYLKVKPSDIYGQTKKEADFAIQALATDDFIVTILRLPMIYGPHAKGNFSKLEAFAKKMIIVPKIKNVRSVLHIENLSRCINFLLLNPYSGIIYPQDRLFFKTTEFILMYRRFNQLPTVTLSGFTFIIKLISIFLPFLNKVYGNKYYDFSLDPPFANEYQIMDWQKYLRKQ
jgi:nucleoside-diphosphate-sugar epimerase